MKFFDRLLTIVVTATVTSAFWIVFGNTLFDMASERSAETEEPATEEVAPAPAVTASPVVQPTPTPEAPTATPTVQAPAPSPTVAAPQPSPATTQTGPGGPAAAPQMPPMASPSPTIAPTNQPETD